MAEYREVETPGEDTPSATGESKGGFWSWVVGIFTEPTATFESIAQFVSVPHPTEAGKTRDKTKWWAAVLFTLLTLMIMTTYVMFTPEGLEAMRVGMESQGQSPISAEQARVFAIPAQLIFVGIFFFVWALLAGIIVHGVSRALGGKGVFRHGRAAVCWSMIVGALGFLVRLVLVAITHNVELELSPSVLFKTAERGDILYKFLNAGFDIFTVWGTVVMLFGIAAMYKISRGKALVPTLVVWAIATALLTFMPQGGSFGGM